jgi:hypothetical protein
MRVEPHQRLTRAAEFGDFREHQSDRFLHAPIRILLQTAAAFTKPIGAATINSPRRAFS